VRLAGLRSHAQHLAEFQKNCRDFKATAKTPRALTAHVDHVKNLQRFAIELGIGLDVDGKAGPWTIRFCVTFQDAYAFGTYLTAPLNVDGIPGPATSKAVDYCRANGYMVSEDFRWIEFRTKNPNRKVTRNNPGILLDRRLVLGAQAVRDHYRSPVVVVSGFRDSFWNAVVGGSGRSQHLLGKAMDFQIRGAVPTESVCRRWFNGIGIESRTTGRVVHCDVRDIPARWYYT